MSEYSYERMYSSVNEYVVEAAKKTPVIREVDVLVCGGGPAGFGAAYAAAQNDAKTLLIERYASLGGGISSWLVTGMPSYQIMPIPSYGLDKPIVSPPCAFPELIRRLGEMGGALLPADSEKYRPRGERAASTWTSLDPELTKYMMQVMLDEVGVEILLHSIVVDAIVENNVIQGVIIENKSGRQAILAKMVIDATGDGDVAAAAEAPYEKAEVVNRPIGRLLPMTLDWRMTNADIDKALPVLSDGARMRRLIQEAMDKGEIPYIPAIRVLPESGNQLSTANISMFNYGVLPKGKWHRKGEISSFGPHIHGDCSEATDLTKAEIETREKILPIVHLLRKNVPGCEDVYLSFTPYQIGLRESRRIIGEYFLTLEDEKHSRRHKDVICRVFMSGRIVTDLKGLFDIPYRCIVPLKVDNLFVAGRCISMDHEAASYLEPREENTCMILGDASGTAAAQCIKEKVRPRELDVKLLQKKLKERGYSLKEDEVK